MKLVTTCPRCAGKIELADVAGIFFGVCTEDGVLWPMSTALARRLEQHGAPRVTIIEEMFELVDLFEEDTPREARRFAGAGRPRGGGERRLRR